MRRTYASVTLMTYDLGHKVAIAWGPSRALAEPVAPPRGPREVRQAVRRLIPKVREACHAA